MRTHTAELLTSAPDLSSAPSDAGRPEIALLGRSNVGKSSFVNSLLGVKSLARVSSTPGKTRLLNFYLVDRHWHLVDMPGYGYAKVSKAEQQRWSRTLARFLQERGTLRVAIALIDVRHGPQPADREMLGYLREIGLKRLLVLNKADKLSRSQLLRSRQAIAAELPGEPLYPYSAHTHQGRDELWRALQDYL